MAVGTAVLLGSAANALAFLDDRLQVFVGETVTRDSNIFRISRDANPNTVLGSSEKGDTFHATTLGFNVDAPVSRQRFQAGADWSRVRYNRFTNLNHTDRNGRLNWLWQAGDRLNGQLGYTDTQSLASFTNFQAPVPNPVRTKTLNGSAAYQLDANWQLQGIVSDMDQRNGAAVRAANDVDLRSVQLGVNYLSAANNRIGVNVSQGDGHYRNAETVGVVRVSNDYVQRSVGASTDWTLTGKSHVAARIDHLRRDYDQFSGRDYSGTTFRAAYDWLATAKLSLTAVAQRDVSAAEDIQTSFVLVKGIALTPSYAVTEKIRLAATLDANVRDYLGSSGTVLGAAGTFAGRVDHVRAATISASYQPMRSLMLRLSGLHEKRTSNVPLADYQVNVVNVSARLTF